MTIAHDSMALMILLVAACDHSPTGPSSFDPPAPAGLTASAPRALSSGGTLTESGRIEVFAYHLDHVSPWHLETAERSWEDMAKCVGVDPDAIHAFPVKLLVFGDAPCDEPSFGGCFAGDPPHIEVLGRSWDFDPDRPEASPGPAATIACSWRHELVHLALAVRDGDADPEHRRPEWSCNGGSK